jgi:hypothetical protein
MRLRHREKLFGIGRCRPMDREAKCRVMHLARCLMRRTEKGRAYGQIGAKAFAVLQTLLWCHHNAKSGRCYPSYQTIAEAAGCARSTVAEAINSLEAAGLLTWVNRLRRVRQWSNELGAPVTLVLRASNAYRFADPKGPPDTAQTPKSEKPTGTKNQGLNPDLLAALDHLKRGLARGASARTMPGWGAPGAAAV